MHKRAFHHEPTSLKRQEDGAKTHFQGSTVKIEECPFEREGGGYLQIIKLPGRWKTLRGALGTALIRPYQTTAGFIVKSNASAYSLQFQSMQVHGLPPDACRFDNAPILASL